MSIRRCNWAMVDESNCVYFFFDQRWLNVMYDPLGGLSSVVMRRTLRPLGPRCSKRVGNQGCCLLSPQLLWLFLHLSSHSLIRSRSTLVLLGRSDTIFACSGVTDVNYCLALLSGRQECRKHYSVSLILTLRRNKIQCNRTALALFLCVTNGRYHHDKG